MKPLILDKNSWLYFFAEAGGWDNLPLRKQHTCRLAWCLLEGVVVISALILAGVAIVWFSAMGLIGLVRAILTTVKYCVLQSCPSPSPDVASSQLLTFVVLFVVAVAVITFVLISYLEGPSRVQKPTPAWKQVLRSWVGKYCVRVVFKDDWE